MDSCSGLQIDVIILAAGVGSRLRPITSTVPKCMVPINNVPLIERLIKQFMFFKDKINIHIVLGYKSEIVINHFKDYKIKISTKTVNYILIQLFFCFTCYLLAGFSSSLSYWNYPLLALIIVYDLYHINNTTGIVTHLINKNK